MEKKDYWKVRSPEFPGGVVFDQLEEARQWFKDESEGTEKGEVQLRRIRLTEEEYNDLSDDF